VPGATPEYPQTSNDAMQLRIQHGGDYETFSDGIIILSTTAGEVRAIPTPRAIRAPACSGRRSRLASPEASSHGGCPSPPPRRRAS